MISLLVLRVIWLKLEQIPQRLDQGIIEGLQLTYDFIMMIKYQINSEN